MYNPADRYTIEQLLSHPYITSSNRLVLTVCLTKIKSTNLIFIFS